MEKTKTLLISALIIGGVALLFSLYSYFSLNKKIANMESVVVEAESAIEKITPLMPHMEVLLQKLPQLEKLLLSVPPTPPATD